MPCRRRLGSQRAGVGPAHITENSGPGSYGAVVVKFRVGRIVHAAFSRDETIMGFGFPRDEREALVASEPDKFLMPRPTEMPYQWVCSGSTPSTSSCGSCSSARGACACRREWLPPSSVDWRTMLRTTSPTSWAGEPTSGSSRIRDRRSPQWCLAARVPGSLHRLLPTWSDDARYLAMGVLRRILPYQATVLTIRRVLGQPRAFGRGPT